MSRFDRNERFFGSEGQRRLRATSVAIAGVGGLGSHVVQQLAHLGVGKIVVIDQDMQDETNKNRNVGSQASDPSGLIAKVDVAERLARTIDPEVGVEKIRESLYAPAALRRMQSVDYVFGCVDNDGARLVLTEHCLAFERPYFDLASDIRLDQAAYGGRVFTAIGGTGCLVCFNELDLVAARDDLSDPAARRDRDDIYGIRREVLNEPGPAVVSINGVVASLGVTEFMLHATSIRPAERLLEYRADQGIMKRRLRDPPADCYYCKEIYGLGERAGTMRYAAVTSAPA